MKRSITLNFTELLLVLLKGKMSVSDSLAILARDDMDKHIRNIAISLLGTMKKGKGLSESLRIINNEAFFEPLYLTLISAAELTGNIEPVLQRIVSDLQRKQKAKETVINILIYPSIIVVLAILGTMILILQGIPFFVSAGMLSGDIMIDAIFGIVAAGSVLLLGGIMLFSVYFRIFYNDSPEFRIFYLLDFLLKSNVTLLESLSHCIVSLGQTKFGKGLVSIKKDIASGIPFSVAFAKVKNFSPYVLGWLSVAGMHGNIGDVCGNIKEYYGEKDNKTREIAARLIEPMIIMLTGVYILIIMVTVVLPILTRTGGSL